ncbi:hypothetical protein DMN77_01650 [Paenibacillus sp. 79R4]|uniref:DUF4129 domain-containing protein n=1 Tax=Paenibacillus sp. 79R4 TaxID=2212847 RepID=UPI0015BF7FD0|nr:DUF4129 domain-containing protein [Paenibacillus sp. 79R4]NWL86300.1 hypothetical protein [Paenibacillus sp. 79R4]
MQNTGNAYITKTLKLCLSCLGEMVVLMPIYLAGIIVLSPQYLPLGWLVILPFVSFLGAAVRSYVPVLWKKLGAAILIGALGAAVFLLNGTAVFSPLVGFCAALFALQGMTATARAGLAKLYWYGVALYFVAGIAYSRLALLRGELGLITWFGVGCLAIALFITNHEYLRYTTLSDHSPLPRGLRRHNRLFIVIILGFVVLLAAGAGRWIGNLLLNLVRYIVAWLTRSPGEPKELEPEEVHEPPAMFFPGEVQKPGLLSQILDILFYVIGGAVIAAIIGFALYWLYKNAGGFWKRSIDRILALLRRQDLSGEKKGYRDEETSIFSWEERKQRLGNWRTALSRFGRRQERYEDMHSNQERVRFLYRRYLLARRSEGCELKPGLTPLEMARDMLRHHDNEKKDQRGKPGQQATHKFAIEPLVTLYYRVRYGGQEPDDREVADIKRMLNL